jgi:hypothetical protein
MFMTRGLDRGAKDRIEIRSELDALAKEVHDNRQSFAILEERLKNHINNTKT